jgi:nucleoside diphosphate kinase
VIEKTVPEEEEGAPMETSLVMVKPDNLARPSTLPGNIIDMFGTTGLYIVGARLFHMSVEQAIRFYGFLESVFTEKLAPQVEVRLRRRLGGIFDFPLTDDDYRRMTDQLREKHAHREMMKIIEYMTGVENPESLKPSERRAGGPATCLGLLYRGPRAVEKIREKLGSTDPSKAAAGTIRSDYGHDLMRNGAHASDSPESAWRERKIVGLLGGEASDERRLIREYLRRQRATVRMGR